MPGVVKFLSAKDIPGKNGYVFPPTAMFEPEIVRKIWVIIFWSKIRIKFPYQLTDNFLLVYCISP